MGGWVEKVDRWRVREYTQRVHERMLCTLLNTLVYTH
jgi:hypothetical protein